MKPDGCPYKILRLLSWMPFLDRLEMAAVSGRSRAAVYEAVHRLEDDGLVSPVPHATDLTPLTARYHLTADGVRLLAREEEIALEDLLRERPVSLQWRAVMLKRLDAAAVVYRLASAVSYAAHLVRFQLAQGHAGGRGHAHPQETDRRRRQAGIHVDQDRLLEADAEALGRPASRRDPHARARRGAPEAR